MRKLLFIAIASLFTLSVNAQEMFNVIASSGTSLKSGASFSKGESVKVNSGGYLALIHVSGKTLEVSEAGTFKCEDLAQKLASSQSSFSAKYGDFLASKMTATDEKGHQYDVTGSVTRDIQEDLVLFAPKNIDMVKEIHARLTWSAIEGNKESTVKVIDLYEEIVFVENVLDTTFMLNLAGAPIDDKVQYFIQVETKDESYASDHEDVVLKVKSTEEAKSIQTIVSDLSSHLNESSPIDNMMMAKFYDSKGMTLNAENSLKNAVNLAPGVEDFRTSYIHYLKSNEAKCFAAGAK